MTELWKNDLEKVLARRLNRRRLLQSAGALSLAVPLGSLLAACGSDDGDAATEAAATTTATEAATTATTPAVTTPTPNSSTAGAATPAATGGAEASPAVGAGTFTDDLGVTVDLPENARVVAYVPIAAGLWDFGIRPVGVFGPMFRADGTREVFVGDIDLDVSTSLGETYGEIDLEKLVELKPDVIVTDLWGPEFDLFGLEGDNITRVESIAPIVSIGFVDRPVTETIGSVERLAVALGADASAPEIVDAREQFDAASDAVRAAASEKPDLSVLVVAAWPEGLYVADPAHWADLIYFRELGVDIVAADSGDDGLWESLSWEQALKYTADVVLNDARSGAFTNDDLAAQAVWNRQPAQQAGQIGPWLTEFVPSYKGFTFVLEDLADVIRTSRADVV